MLYTNAVSDELLELLKKIMLEPSFEDFSLVGGTALSLQMGHRKSIDLDFFGKCEIHESQFLEKLHSYGNVVIIKKTPNIFICTVNGVKVDFVNYNYPLIRKILVVDEIRMTSTQDIAAMKLNAIAGRGSKKDFIDIYYLLKRYSIDEMIGFYREKYLDGSEFMVRKSLTYFDDAETEVSPYLFEKVEWNDMKKHILKQL